MITEARFRRTESLAPRVVRALLRADNESGSAILETAMSAVIVLTFLFGIIETGFALYSYHFISEAAREGTRYAIVRGSSCVNPTDFASACPASTSDIQTYVKNLGYPGIDPTNMTVSVVYAGYPAGVTCTPSTSCNNPGNMIKLTVQYNFPLTVPFVPPHTYAMSSTAAMVIQQ